MIRCGQAEPSPVRISTRVREPRSFGTRQNAVRLSRPQFACVGARLSGRIRLYALTVGPSSACSPCACSRAPATKCQADRAQLRSVGRERVLPVGVRDRQVDVEARSALVGERAAHERRQQPLDHSDLLDGRLEHERPVGRVERGECLRLISYCELMNSWFPANASRPSSSAQRSVFRLICRGSETAPTV